MGIKEYLQTLNKKMKSYDKSAKNPFLEYNYAYNPFKSVISQTYVWVENEQKDTQEDAFTTSENMENPVKKEKGGE